MAAQDGGDGGYPVVDGAPEGQSVAPEAVQVPSPAVQRFLSCRWRKAAEGGVPDHCTHRDVHPMAGTAGFAPDAWCEDCSFFKLRRTPRKRPMTPPEDRFYY